MAKRVKIKNKVYRSILHELFPQMVLYMLTRTAQNIDWLCRTRKDGFTEGEIKYLRQMEGELREMHSRAHKVYYRLKF